MLKALKNLAQKDGLTGQTVRFGDRTVKCLDRIGEGGSANIYKVEEAGKASVYALKHFRLSGNPEAARDVETEVAVMQQLAGCPYTVQCHGFAVAGSPGPTDAWVLMDYCPITLPAFLKQNAYQVDDLTVLIIALPICRAVEALHSLPQPLAHRDVKAENVLRGPDGGWKLCDFGSATPRIGVLKSAYDIALEEEAIRKQTTPAYRAPEMYDLLARECIGLPVDIFALGVLLYLLSFGKLPFQGEAKLQILNGRYTMPEGRPPLLRALIKKMLSTSPKDRPTIQQARLVYGRNTKVIARLKEVTPGEVQTALGGPPDSIVGNAAAPTPAWQHERMPSQSWADFAAADSSSADRIGVSGSLSHHRSAESIGSWENFNSPVHKLEAASAASLAAGSAGSFWASGEEDVPNAPLMASHQEAQQPTWPDPSAAGLVETSPLSAGLARMALDPAPVRNAVGTPAHASAEAPSMLPVAESKAVPSATVADLEALKQHCGVLEQLLDARNAEVHRLQKLVQQQAEEIQKMHRLGQQAEKAKQKPIVQQSSGRITADCTAAHASAMAPPPLDTAASRSGSGSEWISFPGAASRDAPTPTLLQPASSSFKDLANRTLGAVEQSLDQLRSFPVSVTPGASPQPRSAPSSAKPSPGRTSLIGLAATNGTALPMQPDSLMHSRPSSGVSSHGSEPPPKHRRNVTAPNNAFFSDLDPLQ